MKNFTFLICILLVSFFAAREGLERWRLSKSGFEVAGEFGGRDGTIAYIDTTTMRALGNVITLRAKLVPQGKTLELFRLRWRMLNASYKLYYLAFNSDGSQFQVLEYDICDEKGNRLMYDSYEYAETRYEPVGEDLMIEIIRNYVFKRR